MRVNLLRAHGAYRRYRNGCRCRLCTAANTAYYRDYRKENAELVAEGKRRWRQANPKKKAEHDRRHYQKYREKVLATNRRWREQHRDSWLSCLRRYKEKHHDKIKAHHKLNAAVHGGRLQRGSCEVCGATRFVDGHHDDYTRPLDVRWLCRRHHIERHFS